MPNDSELPLRLEGGAATVAAALNFAAVLPAGGFAVALAGPLGAGKSSFARAVLRAMGVTEAIPSPTYTLIEPYETARGPAYHIDLYRLRDAREMPALGTDELAAGALILVEWPERGAADALAYDLALDFDYAGTGRTMRARGLTPAGACVLAAWGDSGS